MRRPRFRFTIGQLIALIAVCAVVFAMIRSPYWMLLIATGLVLPGFAYDRAKGGAGILGAMLAGILLFVMSFLAVDAYYSCFAGEGSLFSNAKSPGAILTFVGLLGLFWGTVVGLFAWIVLFLIDRSLRSRPGKVEPPGPVAWRGMVDRGLEVPVTGGRRP